MWPIIWEFELFGLPITIFSFGTFIVLAFIVSAFAVRHRAARTLGLDKERVLNVCFALLFLGLVGARLLYAFIHHAEFSKQPLSFLQIWEGGLVFYGGLLVGLLWLLWYLPRHSDLKGWAFVDILALGRRPRRVRRPLGLVLLRRELRQAGARPAVGRPASRPRRVRRSRPRCAASTCIRRRSTTASTASCSS